MPFVPIAIGGETALLFNGAASGHDIGGARLAAEGERRREKDEREGASHSGYFLRSRRKRAHLPTTLRKVWMKTSMFSWVTPPLTIRSLSRAAEPSLST